MSTTHYSLESGSAVVAKTAPPISVSLASFAGYQVNEILLWATLIYTILMIGHKLYSIVVDVFGKKQNVIYCDRRDNQPDDRSNPIERRKAVP